MPGTLGKPYRIVPRPRQAGPLRKWEPWGDWAGITDWLSHPRTSMEEVAFAKQRGYLCSNLSFTFCLSIFWVLEQVSETPNGFLVPCGLRASGALSLKSSPGLLWPYFPAISHLNSTCCTMKSLGIWLMSLAGVSVHITGRDYNSRQFYSFGRM